MGIKQKGSYMSKNDYSVFLEIKDKRKRFCIPCGHMSIDEVNKTYNEICDITNTESKCTYIKSATIETTSIEIKNFNSVKNRNFYKFTITLGNFLNTVPCCDILHSKGDCLKCIASGKCTDEFVINSIGKKFFANKYQKTK